MSDRPNSDPPVRAGEIDPDAVGDPFRINAELLDLALSGVLHVDGNGALDIPAGAVGGGLLDTEAVQDIVGGMAGTNLTYDDGAGDLSASGGPSASSGSATISANSSGVISTGVSQTDALAPPAIDSGNGNAVGWADNDAGEGRDVWVRNFRNNGDAEMFNTAGSSDTVTVRVLS